MGMTALYIGIGKYQNTEKYNPLPSEKAAKDMATLLAKNKDKSKQWRLTEGSNGPVLLTSAGKLGISESDMRKNLGKLVIEHNEDLLFYFAGHGRIATNNGREDLLLVASDDPGEPGKPAQGLWVSDLFSELRKAKPNSATVILDCCHSGHAAKVWDTPDTNTILLASSQAHQPAISDPNADVPNFTRLLLQGLKGAARDILGRITPLSLFSHTAGYMEAQKDGHTPVFKGEINKHVVLRHVDPVLSSADFEGLAGDVQITPRLRGPAFEYSDQVVPAQLSWETSDTEYRPTCSRMPPWEKGDDPDKGVTRDQDLMDYYNRLLRAGLVETTDDEYLFWTVMASALGDGKTHGVRLTPLGQYFYSLSSRQ
jgi:hypothetical protein